MAKDIGYTYCIATRNPKQTFVFCKWFTDVKLAIEYAQGEIKDRSQYDVEFILIREGTTNADDPIIWDSRKQAVHLPPEPMRYFIGQRVISGDEICTIIRPPRGEMDVPDIKQWLRLPNGLEQWRAPHNVKPLPNGQL